MIKKILKITFYGSRNMKCNLMRLALSQRRTLKPQILESTFFVASASKGPIVRKSYILVLWLPLD